MSVQTLVLPNGAERTFDYQPRLEPENNNYLVSTHRKAKLFDAEELLRYRRWWVGGQVLDQEAEGACVPHGFLGEALASPVRVRAARTPRAVQALAFDGYDWCRRNDPWAGEDYEGTDVNTGAKWGRSRGWWKSWYWAKNMLALRTALEVGPVVIGVTWTESMYETLPSGVVVVRGQEVGRHCLVITGFSPNYQGTGPRYRWRNSWGLSYGRAGNGYISPTDLNQILYVDGNEACVVDQRAYALAA